MELFAPKTCNCFWLEAYFTRDYYLSCVKKNIIQRWDEKRKRNSVRNLKYSHDFPYINNSICNFSTDVRLLLLCFRLQNAELNIFRQIHKMLMLNENLMHQNSCTFSCVKWWNLRHICVWTRYFYAIPSSIESHVFHLPFKKVTNHVESNVDGFFPFFSLSLGRLVLAFCSLFLLFHPAFVIN